MSGEIFRSLVDQQFLATRLDLSPLIIQSANCVPPLRYSRAFLLIPPIFNSMHCWCLRDRGIWFDQKWRVRKWSVTGHYGWSPSSYTDISYVGPVTSSLCRQPHLRHLSDADEDGRSCTVGRWSTAMKRTSCWHSVCTQSRHIPFPPIDSIWAMMFVWR